jgi:hypothetical protein
MDELEQILTCHERLATPLAVMIVQGKHNGCRAVNFS